MRKLLALLLVMGLALPNGFGATSGVSRAGGSSGGGGELDFGADAWISNITTGKTALTVVGGYDAITTGAADWGSGGTEKHFLTQSHKNRIRQAGSLTRVDFYTVSVPVELTAFYIEVWRETSSNSFTRISQENVLASLAATTINTVTLASPVTVQPGDYIGYGYTASGDPGNFLDSITGAANSTRSTTSAYTETAYAWESQTGNTNILPIKAYMAVAPVIVFIGDSITAGKPDNLSFLEATDTTDIEGTAAYKIATELGVTYQNMGISGEAMTTIRARFTADAINLSPKIIVMNGGVNDVIASTTSDRTLVEYQKCLDLAEAAGIFVFVNSIYPYESSSTANAQKVDQLNYQIKRLVERKYRNAFYVDSTIPLGKFRAAGDAGNLWDLQDAYDSGDGIHLSDAGYSVVANNVLTAMAEASRNQRRGYINIDNGNATLKTAGQILGLLTDPRLLVGFITEPNTAITDADLSGNANTLTYSGILPTERWVHGSGYLLDGATSNAYTIADADSLTFGNGTNDEAVSFFGVFEATTQATEQTIFSKYNPVTGAEKREYLIALDTSNKLRIDIWDETANVKCSRLIDTAITSSQVLHTFAITYTGAGGATAANNIIIYIDGVAVASTATNDASYVAMNNTTQAAMGMASRNTSGSSTLFALNDVGMFGIAGKDVLTPTQVLAIHNILKGHYQFNA